MNKVILMGRLTRDPEVKVVASGDGNMSIARFSLAVDRRVKSKAADAPTADFINHVAFGKTAEFVEKYLKKGTKVVITGRIQTGGYEKDGVKVSTTDIVVEEIDFAESKGTGTSTNATAPAATEQAPASTVGDGFMNIPDGLEEELPFN